MALVLAKSFPCGKKDPEMFDEKGSCGRKVFQTNTPDILLYKLDDFGEHELASFYDSVIEEYCEFNTMSQKIHPLTFEILVSGYEFQES